MFFTSCSNDEKVVNEKVNTLQTRGVADMETLEEYHIAFSLLSNEEKYTAWKDYLNDVLSTEHLNSGQITLINELLSKLKTEAWDKNNSYHAWFTDIYLKDFLIRAKTKFSDTQVINYFYKIGRKVLQLVNSFSEGKVDCTCLKSEWTGWDCGMFNDSNCNTSSCKEVDGCGALNTSFCDGRCS